MVKQEKRICLENGADHRGYSSLFSLWSGNKNLSPETVRSGDKIREIFIPETRIFEYLKHLSRQCSRGNSKGTVGVILYGPHVKLKQIKRKIEILYVFNHNLLYSKVIKKNCSKFLICNQINLFVSYLPNSRESNVLWKTRPSVLVTTDPRTGAQEFYAAFSIYLTM